MNAVSKLFVSTSVVALLASGISAASASTYSNAETWSPLPKTSTDAGMKFAMNDMHVNAEIWSPVPQTSTDAGMKFASADRYHNAETSYPAHAVHSDIVDTAISAGQFGTLAKALTEADLIDTLKGPGPFTVFAPTDAAFAKIPAEQLQALLADKAMLTKVLTYHVVPGKVMAKDVSTGSVKTVEGQNLMLDVSSAGVKVNDANVIKTDIVASNGVIHVIDTVVLPN
jgi:uncharacterized surface protein with fasciclin (FAS1) repeats